MVRCSSRPCPCRMGAVTGPARTAVMGPETVPTVAREGDAGEQDRCAAAARRAGAAGRGAALRDPGHTARSRVRPRGRLGGTAAGVADRDRQHRGCREDLVQGAPRPRSADPDTAGARPGRLGDPARRPARRPGCRRRPCGACQPAGGRGGPAVLRRLADSRRSSSPATIAARSPSTASSSRPTCLGWVSMTSTVPSR